MMNCKFVAERVTELRIKKGISEQKMSFELGHSGNYIQLISSGKMVPSLKEFFAICEFLETSPSLFFQKNIEEPVLTHKAINSIKSISEKDLRILLPLLERFSNNNDNNEVNN